MTTLDDNNRYVSHIICFICPVSVSNRYSTSKKHHTTASKDDYKRRNELSTNYSPIPIRDVHRPRSRPRSKEPTKLF